MPSRTRAPLALTDGYLPLRELATYAGISISTIEDYLHDPVHPLPHYKLGGKILIRRSEYDTWAQSFRVADTPTDITALADAMVRGR